jgi:hypothetical protein
MNLNTDFSDMNSRFKGTNGGHRYNAVISDNTKFDPAPLLTLAGQFVLFGADYYLDRLPPGGSLSVWDGIGENDACKNPHIKELPGA